MSESTTKTTTTRLLTKEEKLAVAKAMTPFERAWKLKDSMNPRYRPYHLGRLGRQIIEFISYPFPEEDGSIAIMIRTTPNDPTTLEKLTIPEETVDQCLVEVL
jgi:hypothetical protein